MAVATSAAVNPSTDSTHRLMEYEMEGTYFQEDSDLPREEDSLWWWNGWWSFKLPVDYGLKHTSADTYDGVIDTITNTARAGVWAEAKLYVTNEFFGWYMNTQYLKFEIINVQPLWIMATYPAIFLAGFLDDVDDFSYTNSDNDEFCFTLGRRLTFLELTWREDTNARTCKQSIGSLMMNDYELDPTCAYDGATASEDWRDELAKDVFEWLFVEELEVIDATDYADDWGSQTWHDAWCLEIHDE